MASGGSTGELERDAAGRGDPCMARRRWSAPGGEFEQGVRTSENSGASLGLATSQERGPGSVAVMHTDYTWTTDALGNVYVGSDG